MPLGSGTFNLNMEGAVLASLVVNGFAPNRVYSFDTADYLPSVAWAAARPWCCDLGDCSRPPYATPIDQPVFLLDQTISPYVAS